MKWMLITSLLLMALMFAGVSVDILNHEGRNWENLAAQAAIERGIGDPHAAGVGEEEEGEAVAAAERTVEGDFNLICASCHGTGGQGDGAAGAALECRPADFTDSAFWEGRDRERILTVIRNGAAAVGGCSLMVGWSASFSPERIEELTDYVMEFRPE
jgi:cytochrome c553